MVTESAEGTDFGGGKGIVLYRGYQERLRTLNACDFGDLLLHNLTLFSQHNDVLEDFHRRFKYILVDEYQDTNVASTFGCACWLRGEKTCAASVTMTSRSTAGGGRR